MPFLPTGSNAATAAWLIAPNQFLADDSGGALTVNPRRFGLPANATAASVVVAQVQMLINLINEVQTTAANQQALALARAMGVTFPLPGGSGDSDTNSNPSYGFNFTPPDYGTNLWLAISSATNGLLSLVLSNTIYTGNGEVYAIMEEPDLTAGWNVTTQVWAVSNQNWIAFTLPMSSPTNLFVWANDWTAETTNGLCCWWTWQYFGNLNESASDLDSQGLNTLGYDYANGLDPNVLSFTVSASSLYVSTTTLPLAINLQAGIPYFVAVLVNDTNYADAVWQPYTGTNLTVTLDGADGIYDVWVGLKGLPADATVTWDTDDIDVTLDRVSPTVSITNPQLANGAATVIKPYLQLQGMAAKPLASLSYDISNALGAVSFIAGQVTDVAGYDPVYCQYMTNYFQCYDVPLATNDNFITLRVTDVAGNTTTTNFDVVLDYTGATNPPVVTVLWPQDGMAVSGTNITIRGSMSDETGTIQAQIVDDSGNTNLIAGLVERNGMFWIENVPLNGTSQISIQAEDAAGNMATNNLTIMPSALTLTINSTPTGDALYQPSGTVSGTVGDPDAVVTVNGVPATVDDRYANADGTYNWSTNNVPIYGMGTATFDATATPAPGSGMGMARAMDASPGTPAANVSLTVEMGPIIKVTHYSFTEAEEYSEGWGGALQYALSDTRTMTYDGKFAPNASGQWAQTYQATEIIVQSRYADTGLSCGTNVQSWSDPEPFYPDYFYGSDGDTVGFSIGHSFAKTVHHHSDYSDAADDGYFEFTDVTVNANTRWTLYTGGKAPLNPLGQTGTRASAAPGSQPQDLFALSAGAYSYEGPPDGLEPWSPTWFWPGAPINGVLGPGIQMLGQPLGSDFVLWSVLPENGAMDLGLTVLKANDDGSWATFTKYHPYINLYTSTTNANLDTDVPEVCVGQQVTFSLNWSPSAPAIVNMVGQWTLPPKFVNQPTNYSATCQTWVENDMLLQNTNQTSCWFYNGTGGKVVVGMNLLFLNGQTASIAADGSFSLVKPAIVNMTNLCSGVNMFTNEDGSLSEIALQYTNGNNGIEIWVYVKRPDYFSGLALITQLVNRQFHWNANPLGLPGSDVTGSYYLDAAEAFASIYLPVTENGNSANPVRPIYLSDGPLLGSPMFGFYNSADAQDDFHDYVRFQPDGGIPVTIGRIDWGWHGKATKSSGAWSLTTSTSYINSPDTSDDSFPTWPSTYHGTRGN